MADSCETTRFGLVCRSRMVRRGCRRRGAGTVQLRFENPTRVGEPRRFSQGFRVAPPEVLIVATASGCSMRNAFAAVSPSRKHCQPRNMSPQSLLLEPRLRSSARSVTAASTAFAPIGGDQSSYRSFGSPRRKYHASFKARVAVAAKGHLAAGTNGGVSIRHRRSMPSPPLTSFGRFWARWCRRAPLESWFRNRGTF